MPKSSPTSRADYARFSTHQTRWRDNDVYGHMNNVVYYEYLDTVVNNWLISDAGLRVPDGDVVGLVVESGCVFHASLGWPAPIEAGLKTLRVGQTSITFQVGLFAPDRKQASAEAHFTHVYVNAKSRRPVSLPETLRQAAETLLTL